MLRRISYWLLPALLAVALFAVGHGAMPTTAILQYANQDIHALSGTTTPHQDALASWSQWTDDDEPDDIDQAACIVLRAEFRSFRARACPRLALPRLHVGSLALPRGPPAT